MKGIELPISTLIIIVIAVIVLLAVVAIFFGVFNPVRTGVDLETAKSNACQMLASMHCVVNTYEIQISNFDADKDGEIDPGIGSSGYWTSPGCDGDLDDYKDNLQTLCYCHYGVTSETSCKETVCGCPKT